MSSAKTDLPDSDQTARHKHSYEDGEPAPEEIGSNEGLQTSNKSGKHSSVEKLAAHRPEFGTAPGARPVPGAFGDDDSHIVTGRNAGPDTNQLRCNSCGRWFNTQAELSAHEPDCRLAKEATASGRESLRHEDATPHARNDAESK
jgi:hypothetical protein